MANLTRQLIRERARLYAMDTATVSPGLTDTEWNLLISDALYLLSSMLPDHEQYSIDLGTAATVLNDTEVVFSGLAQETRNASMVLCDGRPMERKDYEHILRLQLDESATGVPSKWAIRPASSVSGRVIAIHPIASGGQTLTLWGQYQPTDFANDSATTLFGSDGSRAIALIAAVSACPLLGRDSEFMASLMQRLPDKERSILVKVERDRQPKARRGKQVA